MGVEFVHATAADIHDYIRIGRSVISKTYLTVTDPKEVEAQFKKGTTYMIRTDGRAVGYITYIRHSPAHAELDELAIEPSFQGKGIGSRALEFILTELREVDVIELVTHPRNFPAKKLYAHYGFCETGKRIENYWGSDEPRIEMMLIRV